MEKWAFATSASPFGLGLPAREFWYLSHEEYRAKVRFFERYRDAQNEVIYMLRADIHNSSENLNRQDKRRWTARDFGADEPAESQQKPRSPSREQVRAKALMTFGPGENGSVLKGLKGQSLPVEIQTRINVAKTRPKPKKQMSPNLRRLKGQ